MAHFSLQNLQALKRTGNLLNQIADIDNLRLAFWKAKKGKSYAANVTAFRNLLDRNLLILRNQILSGEVNVGHHKFFKIFDPKERLICESSFQEQVLHHALMNICHERFERHLIHDSYACRKNKGTYAALARAKQFSRQNRYFLKLDVNKYFASVNHFVLFAQLERIIKDESVLKIFWQIISCYRDSENCGLPIGNLTSQYFANHYISGLDHEIKEQWKVKAYVRYMDDLVLWSGDPGFLKGIRDQIHVFTESRLRCALKPSLLNYSSCGLPFLGYLIMPYHVRLSQRSKQRFIRKMNALQEKYDSGEWNETKCQRHVLPLLAFLGHADTGSFRKKVLNELN